MVVGRLTNHIKLCVPLFYCKIYHICYAHTKFHKGSLKVLQHSLNFNDCDIERKLIFVIMYLHCLLKN